MMRIAARLTLFVVALLLSFHSSAMVEMSDDQLSGVTGQALMQMGKEFGAGVSSDLMFYKAGLDVEMAINMNIEKLQLGCGGVNDGLTPGRCDLDIDAFSLGCVANSFGGCITLNPLSGSNQKPGAIRDCGSAGCTTATVSTAIQSQFKDFVLTRPFFQFAIRNDDTATMREVVGIRMGAEQSSGPLSFGSLNAFSGYMSGEANVFMQGETDVSPTCRSPDVCPDTAGRSRYTDASAYLGLNDAQIISILGYRIRYKNLTMDYSGQSREGVPAEVVGNRITQIPIPDLRLADLVDDIIDTVSVNRICALTIIGTCSFIISDGVANALLPVLSDGISTYIKNQLATGLNINVNDLNTYAVPYNLKNIHQLDVSTSLFGLSFQKEAVQYPGYASAVLSGWAMYAPEAFSLVIDDKVSSFVQAIAGSSDARDGNIVGLPASYRNCWGTVRFC